MDAAPPEAHISTDSSNTAPQSVGPAPWVPSCSPDRRISNTRLGSGPGTAGVALNGGGRHIGASTSLAAALPRIRARGNVPRAGPLFGDRPTGCANVFASPPALEKAEEEPGIAIKASSAAKEVTFAPRMAASTAPPDLRAISAPSPEVSCGSHSNGKKPTGPPPPELVLAERARERVRARREKRARSELPP